MRMSRLLVQTSREAPTKVTLPGYRFLLRGGFVRPLSAGCHCFLPPGARVRRRIEAMVHQGMRVLGGQEVSLPAIQPAELWSGAAERDDLIGQTVSSLRRQVHLGETGQRDIVLATSHEELLLAVARTTIQSYRQLPALLYQAWPVCQAQRQAGAGLFGARETLVADAYSLHPNEADLDRFYPQVQAEFGRIFDQCRLEVLVSAAGRNHAGAVTSHSLVWPSGVGGEKVVACGSCSYVANQAIAQAGKTLPPAEDMQPMEDVETPECKTIADLARFLNVPASRTAKALFLVASGEGENDRFVIAIVRGDTDLNESKLRRVLGVEQLGPATEGEIRRVGSEPGYGSPVGVEGVTVVVDELVPQSPNLVAGANRPDYHKLNVNYGRDYGASVVADITAAGDGDACPECGAALRAVNGVVMATVAKVSEDYSRAMKATFLDRSGQAQFMLMGRYRLYADRLLAAVAEAHHDDYGIIWPGCLAPYDVYLMPLGKRNEAVAAAADDLYADLTAAGIDVLYDDRDERAGVKFHDADLLGVPVRVVVGHRGLESGTVELKRRDAEDVETVQVEDVVSLATRHLACVVPTGRR